jgi:hypothetical protein
MVTFGAQKGIDGSRKRESLLDNGEDEASSIQPRSKSGAMSPQEMADTDWDSARKEDSLQAWPLDDLEADADLAQSERRARANSAGPSSGQSSREGNGAGWYREPFWGSPEPEVEVNGGATPPEGFSTEEWQRLTEEIEADWGPSTWQPTGPFSHRLISQ